VVIFKLKLTKAGDDVCARLAEGLGSILEQLHALLLEWIQVSGLGGAPKVNAVLEHLSRVGRKKEAATQSSRNKRPAPVEADADADAEDEDHL
jgi:hypothetical protein